MAIKIKLFTIIICCANICFAQQWFPLLGGVGGAVYTIEANETNNSIYVGGLFTGVDTIQNSNGLAFWNGINWNRLGGITNGLIGPFTRNILKLLNDTVYLGGDFYNPNVFIAVLPLNGFWQAHSQSSDFLNTSSMGITHAGIADFILFNNELYAGGSFINGNYQTTNYNTLNNIARWNGMFWEPVGNPPGVSKYESPFDISFIEKMLVYNNELFIFGSFDSVGGISAYNVAKWNGSIWSDVDGGHVNHPPVDPGGLFCATIYNGTICTAGSYFGIHQWNGTNWSVIGNTNHSIYDMIEYNGDLIVTGAFTTINGIQVNGIARWDGQNWHPYGTGLALTGQPFGYGACLEVLNTDLYVGGYFDSVDGVAANGIARYGFQTNINDLSERLNFSVYPNPSFSKLNISFNLQKNAQADLQLFNSLGQVVKTISKEKLNAGENKINFSTDDISPGIYFLKFTAGDKSVTRKVVKM